VLDVAPVDARSRCRSPSRSIRLRGDCGLRRPFETLARHLRPRASPRPGSRPKIFLANLGRRPPNSNVRGNFPPRIFLRGWRHRGGDQTRAFGGPRGHSCRRFKGRPGRAPRLPVRLRDEAYDAAYEAAVEGGPRRLRPGGRAPPAGSPAGRDPLEARLREAGRRGPSSTLAATRLRSCRRAIRGMSENGTIGTMRRRRANEESM